MTQHYNTTAAYISGGICGPIRWPHGAMAGRPLRKNLRGRWGILDCFTEPASFREALLRLLCEEPIKIARNCRVARVGFRLW